jgi:hypothetical protein
MDKLNRLASWREHWVGLRVLMMSATLTQEDRDPKRPASMVTTKQHALLWLVNFTTMLWLTALYNDADIQHSMLDVWHVALAACQRGIISIPAQLWTKLILTIINRERRQDKVGAIWLGTSLQRNHHHSKPIFIHSCGGSGAGAAAYDGRLRLPFARRDGGA